MIHFRYFDTNYDHNGLWEDLIDAFPALFASAASIEDLPAFLETLEAGSLQGIVVLIFHFHEPRVGGGYYRLTKEEIARWRTPTQVIYVTGGEVERVTHQIGQSQLPDCIRTYPHSLGFIRQWTPAQRVHWREYFESLKSDSA